MSFILPRLRIIPANHERERAAVGSRAKPMAYFNLTIISIIQYPSLGSFAGPY